MRAGRGATGEGEDLAQLCDRRGPSGVCGHVAVEHVEASGVVAGRRGLVEQQRHEGAGGSPADAPGLHVGHHRVAADLVGFVERDEGRAVQRRRHAGRVEHAGEELPMIQTHREVGEAQAAEHLSPGREQLGLDGHRGRAGGIDVALVELAEAALLRPIGAPHRLHLVALEELGQRGPVFGHHARQRHGEVVAQGEIGLAGLAVFATLQDLEDQPVAFFAVLAREGLDVLDRRRLERLEAVALEHPGDDAYDVLAPANVGRQEVAHAARRLGGGAHLSEPRRLRRPCSRDGTPRSCRHTSGFPPPRRRSMPASPCPAAPSPASAAGSGCLP